MDISSEKLCHFAYLLLCADGSVYAGYSTDPVRRSMAHNRGVGAKYTRSRLPVTLAYTEGFATKGEALSREAALKRLSHSKKLELIAAFKTDSSEGL